MAKIGIFLTLILKLYSMTKTKKVTVSMTEETQNIAEQDSHKWNLKTSFKDKSNISGYISYLINKAHLEAQKQY